MRPESLELELKSRVSVSQIVLQKLKSTSPNVSGNVAIETEFLGSVIRDGQLAWFAVGSSFEVFSVKTGQRVAGHLFDSKCVVTCVAEIPTNDIHSCLLLIAVQRAPVGGVLYLFSVQGSRIVHRIDVIDKITSCCFISDAACKRSNIRAFNGCAAVGTDAGEVFLIDLNLNRCKEIISNQMPYNHQTDDAKCKILSTPIDHDEIRFNMKHSRAESVNLGIRLDMSVIKYSSAISSILSMPKMQMIVVGFENGIMALFNLVDLNALHLAYPPEGDSPLVKLTFLEPADDPRPTVYIWAFHANHKNYPFAVMHAVSFTSKAYQDGENIYETFQWCRPDLTIPIYETDSIPITCQSVTKIVAEEEDEQYSLCVLAWANRISSFVLVFDLNQWYKEQMPKVCDWRDYPSYLAPFPIEISDEPLSIWLNPQSVGTFNSIQRPEEHFYPTSLSFDLIELTSAAVYNLQWAGLQNNAIKKLSSTGAVAILLPDEYFDEFIQASLIPQLSDQNYHANPSKKMKQEFLLSMALEYNCMSLLRECAQHWADGSHMGRGSSDALTLSTLTDWIWSQATLIKDRCNDLCISLFDDSGITIDLRSRKILTHYSRQLKLLADLLHLIISNYRQYIPDEIFDTLTAQRNSIRMTSEYQEVLQWLLNMGLLPEIVWNQTKLPELKNDPFTATPYPYRTLSDFYTAQRQRFYEIDRNHIVSKTKSCKCLYIDSFIDRECNSNLLRNEWNIGLGDGLYPPPSLQAMLRILLIPGISLEKKYTLFVYLFLDLHCFLDGEQFEVVQNLIKFPAVFKLNSSLIKTTQAFWNLDHNEYEIALSELISPLTSDRFITQWQQELLVNTLLIRDMPHLALQAIRAPGPSINTLIRIKTLLANNLITEAFELQRSKFDENLLIEFFKGCHEHKKWNYVLGLSLNEREGEILCKFLRTHDSLLSENLHLLYLLQRNKYIDALTYLDETKNKYRSMAMQEKLGNTQDLIMSSYKMAMNSTNRTLCDQYMTIKDHLQIDVQQSNDVLKPLSSELNPFIVDSNANVVGSVFHRAIVSAKRSVFNVSSNKNHIPLLGNIRIDLDSNETEEFKPILEPKPYIGLLKRRKEISYENNADPDTKQPAAKRQRVDSFSIADVPLKKHSAGISSFLVTSLANQSQSAKKLNSPNASPDIADENNKRNSMGELCDTVNLLSTPIVKSTLKEKRSRIESRCQTPQSILKQRHTDMGSVISRRSTSPSLTVNSAKRSVDFNAKSFCYTFPVQSDEYRLGAIRETVNLPDDGEDEDEDDVDDDNCSPITPATPISGRRPIHSAKSSTASNSVDEFYSPETSKIQEEQVEMDTSEHQNISHISHESNVQSEAPAISASTSYVKPRRKLRSTTPEVAIMSSTRLTRSRSKQNLEESVDREPILNTSTPKRATPKRSSARMLTKNVLTSNAKKVAEKQLADSQYAEGSDEADSVEMSATHKQRNFLKDASDVSLRQRSLYAYSIVYDTDGTQPSQNLLSDSSVIASDCSVDRSKEPIKYASMYDKNSAVEVQTNQLEVQKQAQEEIEEANTQSINTDISSTEEVNTSAEMETNEPTESEQTQEDTTNEQINQSTTTAEADQEQPTEASEPQSSEAISSSSGTVEKPAEESKIVTETVTEETEITITQSLPQNYLIDSSMGASESIVQKFSRYEHYTSSFFSETQQPQNILEDSSQLISQETVEIKSNAGSENDAVNVDDSDSKSEVLSNNNTISSDSDDDREGNLIYEGSDNDDDVEEEVEINDDDVIQISSDSESNNEFLKSDNELSVSDDSNAYDELKYDINEELGAVTSTQAQRNDLEQENDYNITELQAAQVRLDIPPTESSAQSIISQEQAMNEMIYGNLGVADAEMLDLDVHNEAFGFEMHGNEHGTHQSDIYLNDVPTTSNQQLVLDDAPNAPAEQMDEVTSAQKSPEPNVVDEQGDGVAKNEVVEEVVVENEPAVVSSAGDEEFQPSISIEAEIPHSTEPAADETNILDKVITESVFIQYTVQPLESPSQSASDDVTMEVTEEPTNIFENAATESVLAASSTIDEDVQMNAGKEPEVDPNDGNIRSSEPPQKVESEESVEKVDSTDKTDEKESDSKRPNTPSRRTRRAASQQSETVDQVQIQEEANKAEETESKSKTDKKSKQMEKIESKHDETDTSEIKPKSRSVRAKSQQPIVEPSKVEPDRKKRGASESKSITITLSRSEVQQYIHDSSQQKEKPQTETDAQKPSTSKAVTLKRQRTTSATDAGLGDKFDAEESTSSRRLRKATSHQSLSDIAEDTGELSTPKKDKPSATRAKSLRRSVSHQSLSSASDSDSKASEKLIQRSTRSKSTLSLEVDAPSTPRTRRAASKQNLDSADGEKTPAKDLKRKKLKSESSDTDSELGERFDANESSRSRRLRKAVSHQTLTKIDESAQEGSPPKKSKTSTKTEPATPRTRRSLSRAASHQSLSSAVDSNAGDENEPETTAKRTPSRKRLKSESSDIAAAKEETESTSSKSQTRRGTRSSKKDDDQQSDASSIVSSRSRSRKASAHNDDDSVSVKSSRSRSVRSTSTLPSIPENANQSQNILPQEYLETSRLTRSQRANIEKYSKLKEKSISESDLSARRSSRKAKVKDTEQDSDHSDTESILSQKSNASKLSKKSKTSEASQRTTRSQRSQNK